MSLCTRSASPRLVVPVDDPDKIARGHATGPGINLDVKAMYFSHSLGRDKNTMFVSEQMTVYSKSAGKEYNGRLPRSNSKGESSSNGSCANEEVPRRHVHKIIEALFQN